MLRLFACVKKTSNRFLFFLPVLFLFFEGHNLAAQEFFTNLEDSIQSPIWINTQTIDSGYAYSGHHYSVADSSMIYGLGVEAGFPEQYKNKNTVLNVEGWIKSDIEFDEAVFVLSIIHDGNQVFWKGIDLSSIIEDAGNWFYFSDSVIIPSDITSNGIIKSFLWNSDEKNVIAIDDLHFGFKFFDNPTFLPDIDQDKFQEISSSLNIVYQNDFYKIGYDENSKEIIISGDSNEAIVRNISYYSEGQINRGGLNFELLNRFDFKGVKKIKSGKKLIFRSKCESLKLQMALVCQDDSPEVRFEIEEKYMSSQEIIRESILFDSDQKITEVYRANRKSKELNFDAEYWLDKQGVKFGIGSSSMFIYHETEVSSMQLVTERKQLWVNLDLEKDHPFLHFPLDQDTSDYMVDWSRSTYKKGNKKSYSFSIVIGAKVKHLPRFMKNPNGFLATYIWTEHADFTNLRTNRATYFGSETITHADSAIGGFAKFQIPVTKSVFYNNPDEVTNSEVSHGAFTEMESSIIEDPLYLQFLEQIWSKGTEVCLHTPENFTSNEVSMEKALDFMMKKFGSPTWIDHGYNNGINNNREDLACDGTIKKSPFYAMDLWEKYGVKYLWNSYYEDHWTFEKWRFGEFIEQPFSGFGDFFPNPDFWKHETRTGNLTHWPTKSVLYVENDNRWNYRFNKQILDAFVSSWGVEINHCYPAWTDPKKAFWVYDFNSHIVAAPGLNRTLENMALLHDQKKLNVTTIQGYLDYQLSIQNLKYEIIPDGRVKITNNNANKINGLSFATKAKIVLVDDQMPEHKYVGDDIIFWFDLLPGESKLIRTID